MKLNQYLNDIYSQDENGTSRANCQAVRDYDAMVGPSISMFFTPEDIKELHDYGTRPYWQTKPRQVMYAMNNLMAKKGFKPLSSGTNRRTYECVFDNRFVMKIATGPTGYTSNLREYRNQEVLKPFCCKTFDVTPDGTMACQERVYPIIKYDDFKMYAEDIFKIMYFKIRQNNILMDDIGARSFKNWGYRNGFGPVLLDYPTMYIADPKKKYCTHIIDPYGKPCNGTIDYDECFNIIMCTECGQRYFPSGLALPDGDDLNKLLEAVGYRSAMNSKKGKRKMKITLTNEETNEVVFSSISGGTHKVIERDQSQLQKFEPKMKATLLTEEKTMTSDSITPVSNESVSNESVSNEIEKDTEPIEKDTEPIEKDTEPIEKDTTWNHQYNADEYEKLYKLYAKKKPRRMNTKPRKKKNDYYDEDEEYDYIGGC